MLKKIGIAVMIVFGIIGFIVMCQAFIESQEKVNGYRYSDTYNSDASYRQDVKDIAKAYGTTEYEVDKKLNAASDALN